MASLRRNKNFNPDPHAKFLYYILRQMDLRSIDWQAVADDIGIPNGHAARMRYSRLKGQFEAIGGGIGATKVREKKAKDGKKGALNKKGKGKEGYEANWKDPMAGGDTDDSSSDDETLGRVKVEKSSGFAMNNLVPIIKQEPGSRVKIEDYEQNGSRVNVQGRTSAATPASMRTCSTNAVIKSEYFPGSSPSSLSLSRTASPMSYTGPNFPRANSGMTNHLLQPPTAPTGFKPMLTPMANLSQPYQQHAISSYNPFSVPNNHVFGNGATATVSSSSYPATMHPPSRYNSARSFIKTNTSPRFATGYYHPHLAQQAQLAHQGPTYQHSPPPALLSTPKSPSEHNAVIANNDTIIVCTSAIKAEPADSMLTSSNSDADSDHQAQNGGTLIKAENPNIDIDNIEIDMTDLEGLPGFEGFGEMGSAENTTSNDDDVAVAVAGFDLESTSDEKVGRGNDGIVVGGNGDSDNDNDDHNDNISKKDGGDTVNTDGNGEDDDDDDDDVVVVDMMTKVKKEG